MTKEEALQLQNSIKQLGSSNVAEMLLTGRSNPSRPKVSRHLRRMTYYRERFALQIKVIIDEMISEYEQGILKERFFRYEHFKDALSKNSLYLKINQSWLYLRTELDVNNKYKAFNDLIHIIRRNDGIRIKYQVVVSDKTELKPEIVDSEIRQKKDYETKIEHFLINAKINENLTLTNLILTPEDISTIETSICQLDNIIYKISSTKIWMVKISE